VANNFYTKEVPDIKREMGKKTAAIEKTFAEIADVI
jgi:hypothetical protein